MEWKSYLDHIRADADLISDAARLGLDADAPCCDRWTVRTVVEHVGDIYTEKAKIVEEGWIERQDRRLERAWRTDH